MTTSTNTSTHLGSDPAELARRGVKLLMAS